MTLAVSREQFSSFQQFVTVHEAVVFTFCFRMLGDTKLAECVAAKAFRDVCVRFPNITLSTVLAAACHTCRKQLHHDYSPTETAVNEIQQIFDQLTIPEREVMTLRYACKLDFAQIASILHCSSEAVRVILRQGRWHVASMTPALPDIPLNT